MRYSRLMAWSVLFAGVMVTGAQAKAEDSRDLRHDYHRAAAMRNDISRDRARLYEAERCGRYAEAAAIRRDIARDEANLHAQYRDIRHDRRDRW
jgi:hypothetical protein